MIIKAGTVLTLEEGAYSAFGYSGPYMVLKDMDQAETVDAFKAQWKQARSMDSVAWRLKEQGHTVRSKLKRISTSDFTAWLVKGGYIEDVTHSFRWYIGSYGFDPEIG